MSRQERCGWWKEGEGVNSSEVNNNKNKARAEANKIRGRVPGIPGDARHVRLYFGTTITSSLVVRRRNRFGRRDRNR